VNNGAGTNLGPGTAGIGTNLFGTNPLFINAAGADFRLQEGSPALNTGLALTLVTTDILGVARPQRTGYDMGAYEKI
jgi:hypothetical protein